MHQARHRHPFCCWCCVSGVATIAAAVGTCPHHHQGYSGIECNSQYVQLPAWRSSSKCNKVRNNISPRYISITSLWMYQYINILCAGLRATEATNGVPYWSCSHPSTFVWPDTARGHWALIKLSTVLGTALHSGNMGTGLTIEGLNFLLKSSFLMDL